MKREDILSLAYSIGTVGEPWWLDDEDLIKFADHWRNNADCERQRAEDYYALLRQALEALEKGETALRFAAIAALRERLA